MKRFAVLITQLEETTKTTQKTKAIAAYLQSAPDQDRMWCLALFSGRRPKRAITTKQLREWASAVSGLPLWLLEDSYAVVGDLGETIALLLPSPEEGVEKSLTQWINDLRALTSLGLEEKRDFILASWNSLGGVERFVFNKLITGGFRVGVSQKLMARAVSQVAKKTEAEIIHRLMGNWHPDETNWHDLIEAEDFGADFSKPYPFFLSSALESEPQNLGTPSDWGAEWKWDGIRGQVIIRGGSCFAWSRGGELITQKFPEFNKFPDFLPDGTVLDGEILVWQDEHPLPFNTLQTRIGRKSLSKSILKDSPVILYAYDLLEWLGEDIRKRPYRERRKLLEGIFSSTSPNLPFRLSPLIAFSDWISLGAKRSEARDRHAEGLMLKKMDSRYEVGRKKGPWWKWKLDPLKIDAVMIYAQAGHGRRANLYTDFTFAVWKGNELVPFTKAYSGLKDAEFREISGWVRRNTLRRFGPVRQVTPEHVFEIAFEGIHESKRHKSGVALRFPRMSRWRHDKKPDEANTLEDLKELLKIHG